MDDNTRVTPLQTEYTLEENILFNWKLNFHSVSSIRTPVFGPRKEAGTKLYFDVWLRKSDAEKISIKVFLRKYSQSPAHSKCRFEYNLSVHYGSLYNISRSKESILLSNLSEIICLDCNSNVCDAYGDNSIIHSRKLFSEILVLKCRMSFFGHTAVSLTSHYESIEDLQNLKKFNKNFETLYLSNELCDVSIQIGEKTFMSHKFVLSAHSPVFKTMLTQEFQEAKTGVITISDIEPEIFECFLKFLYTGEMVAKSISNCMQLYFLADKYDVQNLKQECFKILTDPSLNENEIDEVLEMAYQYKDDPLKKAAKKLLITTIKKK